jgi:hypothetical protein
MCGCLGGAGVLATRSTAAVIVPCALHVLLLLPSHQGWSLLLMACSCTVTASRGDRVGLGITCERQGTGRPVGVVLCFCAADRQ